MAAELIPCKTKDFLEQDPSIRGQGYVCLSFLSPEDVIKQKEIQFFSKFLGSFANDLGDFFTNMTEKFKEDTEVLDLVRGLKERHDYVFGVEPLQAAYDFFKSSNSEKLEGEYLAENDFQTSVRGIKVRGSYETFVEAKNRAKAVKKFDTNFDVYVAEVGCWCPWAPNPEDIKDVEYAETQLNTMMKKYKDNQEKKREYYELRKNDMMQNVKMHADASEQKPSIQLVSLLGDASGPEPTVDELKAAIDQQDTWTKRQESEPVENNAAQE